MIQSLSSEKSCAEQLSHTIPRSANEYSFSELDRALFVKYNLARLRGIDEFFTYELNRDPKFLDDEDEIPKIMEGYSVHRLNIRLARFSKYGYRRWSR